MPTDERLGADLPSSYRSMLLACEQGGHVVALFNGHRVVDAVVVERDGAALYVHGNSVKGAVRRGLLEGSGLTDDEGRSVLLMTPKGREVLHGQQTLAPIRDDPDSVAPPPTPPVDVSGAQSDDVASVLASVVVQVVAQREHASGPLRAFLDQLSIRIEQQTSSMDIHNDKGKRQ